MVAVGVLYSTTEPKVVRNYVIALWIADIGHVVTTGYVMGYEKFVDFANYNPTTWGNVGATVSDHSFDATYSLFDLCPRSFTVQLEPCTF